MGRSFATGLLVMGVLVSFPGCATAPMVRQPIPTEPVAAPASTPTPVVAVAAPPAKVAVPVRTAPPPAAITPPPTITEPPELVPEGEASVLVESEPIGATIVVNGIPVGKAPRKVMIPMTAQGFVRDTFSIKARFVAETSSQQSSTIEFELTPLDRMPSGLVFTPEKVVRKR